MLKMIKLLSLSERPSKVSDVSSREELMYIMEIALHILFISADSISHWSGSFVDDQDNVRSKILMLLSKFV